MEKSLTNSQEENDTEHGKECRYNHTKEGREFLRLVVISPPSGCDRGLSRRYPGKAGSVFRFIDTGREAVMEQRGSLRHGDTNQSAAVSAIIC